MFKALFGSENVGKKTDFMKGRSILSQLGGSNYGKIKKTMNECFDQEFNDKYTLPKIVVTGDENVGKSSLLENITKCPIFPRDNRFCTKCPTHIKMVQGDSEQYYVEFDGNITYIKDKSEISNIVKKYMNTIDGAVTSKEIVIGIQGPNVPTLELYDLPGIVNLPKETAKKITKICKTYLREPNVIPICVAPATISSMSNSKTIAILEQEGLQNRSIFVLTKIDLVNTSIPDNLRQLVQRLVNVKKYGMIEGQDTKHLEFASTVGIINRTHDDSKSLEENDEYEKKWFDTNLIQMIGDSDVDGNKEFISELGGKLGIKNLLEVIDNYYSRFIMENWKPNIEKKIKKDIKNLQSSMDDIGMSIVDLDNTKYEETVAQINVDFKEMYRDSYLKNDNYYSCVQLDRRPTDIISDCEECDMYYKLNNIVKNLEIPLDFIKIVDKEIEKYFEEDETEYKLSRFEQLKISLSEYIAFKWEEYFKKNRTRLIWALSGRIDNYYIDCEFGDFEVFNKIVNKMFRALVFEPLYHEWDFEINKHDLVENDEASSNRSKVMIKIQELQKHLERLGNM
jgi:GTP-binding protein EngB required for normal cell division